MCPNPRTSCVCTFSMTRFTLHQYSKQYISNTSLPVDHQLCCTCSILLFPFLRHVFWCCLSFQHPNPSVMTGNELGWSQQCPLGPSMVLLAHVSSSRWGCEANEVHWDLHGKAGWDHPHLSSLHWPVAGRVRSQRPHALHQPALKRCGFILP